MHKGSWVAQYHFTFLIQSTVDCGRKRSKRSSAFSAVEAPRSCSDESFRATAGLSDFRDPILLESVEISTTFEMFL